MPWHMPWIAQGSIQRQHPPWLLLREIQRRRYGIRKAGTYRACLRSAKPGHPSTRDHPRGSLPERFGRSSAGNLGPLDALLSYAARDGTGRCLNLAGARHRPGAAPFPGKRAAVLGTEHQHDHRRRQQEIGEQREYERRADEQPRREARELEIGDPFQALHHLLRIPAVPDLSISLVCTGFVNRCSASV